MELKRRQATSIVLLGVIGAEFGQDVSDSKRKNETDLRKKTTVEGFGLGPNQNLARLTSTQLIYYIALEFYLFSFLCTIYLPRHLYVFNVSF